MNHSDTIDGMTPFQYAEYTLWRAYMHQINTAYDAPEGHRYAVYLVIDAARHRLIDEANTNTNTERSN